MWLLLVMACGGSPTWWGRWAPVDAAAAEGRALEHYARLVEMAPPAGDCDGPDRVLAGEPAQGCRFRPARSIQEAGQLSARCKSLLDEPGVDEQAGLVGLVGAWSALPVPLTTCAFLVERRGTRAQRTQLPPDEVALRGIRWEGWLAIAEARDAELLRGWVATEERCSPWEDEACAAAIASVTGVLRVDVGDVLLGLREARADAGR